MRPSVKCLLALGTAAAVSSCKQAHFIARPSFVTPLVVDWNRDGRITTRTAMHAAPVSFDFAGDGQTALVDWLAPVDRFLVLDRDRDGFIRDGRELFGDGTRREDGSRAPDGFAALALLDENHDGRVDGRDRSFKRLALWGDLDGDGLGSPDELTALVDAGIDALPLAARRVPKGFDRLLGYGSSVALSGRFADTAGRRGLLLDVVFQHLEEKLAR